MGDYNPGWTMDGQWLMQSVLASQNWTAQLARENERLRHQLQTKTLNEEAFKDVCAVDGRALTLTKGGRWVELLDREAEWAVYVKVEELEGETLWVMVGFSGDICIPIRESDFLSDKRLINQLQIAGIRVRNVGSRSQTAGLIRAHIMAKPRQAIFPLFAGWRVTEKTVDFSIFPSGGTHRGEFPELPKAVGEKDCAEAMAAIIGFEETMYRIRDAKLRRFLCLWMHCALLHTLLRNEDAELSFGLCLCTDNTSVRQTLLSLLCWYGDKAINLGEPMDEFVRSLWARKDQAIVVVDRGRTKSTEENLRVFGEALVAGKICLPRKKEKRVLPLQGPLLFVTDSDSAVICFPELLALDITVADVSYSEENCWRFLGGYLTTMASYVQNNYAMFAEALRAGRKQAYDFCVREDADSKALGTLLGMAEFLRRFYVDNKCHRTAAVLLGAEDLAEEIGALISRIGAGYFGGDFAAQFCSMAQQGIRDGWFHLCNASQATDDPNRPTVYRVKEDLGFSREAFRLVCNRMGQSGPVVAHALAEANVLRGKTINATTYQTRISVCNAYGITRMVPVYRIGELDFEML